MDTKMGKCPNCGNIDLFYGECIIDHTLGGKPDGVFYYYDCADCKTSGKEYFLLHFLKMTIDKEYFSLRGSE